MKRVKANRDLSSGQNSPGALIRNCPGTELMVETSVAVPDSETSMPFACVRMTPPADGTLMHVTTQSVLFAIDLMGVAQPLGVSATPV